MEHSTAPDKQLQPQGAMEPGFGKRLWHVVLAVYYMLHRGLGRKRIMDLHLLLGRGKLAGKALRGLLASSAHPHGHHTAAASSSALSFYHNPRDVEFSCTTTPSYAPAVFSFLARGRGRGELGGLDAAAVARAFEMLNAEAGGGGETPAAAEATPSPMVGLWSFGRTPAVTDSPFPVVTEGDVGERVDAEAEHFIRRFYEQLRLQQSAATPEYGARRRG